jgi:hypothetical protein
MESNPSTVRWSELIHAGVRAASQIRVRFSMLARKLCCIRLASRKLGLLELFELAPLVDDRFMADWFWCIKFNLGFLRFNDLALAGFWSAEKLWKELKQVHFSTGTEAGCLPEPNFAPAGDQPAMHARSTGGKTEINS